MSITSVPPTVLQFLNDIKENNNREWFKANKVQYDEAHEKMVAFADSLIGEMKRHDNIDTPSAKRSLYRIYRDVRFSKNKVPYKSSWSGYLRRATARLRGGYYYHIEPGNSYVAGGFWGPSKDDLARIREEIAADPSELREILSLPETQKLFGEMRGRQLKTAPRGYPKDHPAVELLRYKSFVLRHDFTDEEICKEGFVEEIARVYVSTLR